MGDVYAVVTAGGRVPPPFAAIIGTDVKALAPLGRRRLIDPVIDAARNAGVCGLAIVGPPAVRAHCSHRVDRFVEGAQSGVENILRALRAFPQAERIAFLTSDMPFVDAAGSGGLYRRLDGLGA